MSFANRLFFVVVVLSACVGCDQATKRLAEFALKDARPLSFFGNVFRLEYAENPGAFLSLGSSLSTWHRFLLLTVASSLVLAALAVFVFVRKNLRASHILGYALILAGGLSNMIDRLSAGFVVDFLNLGVGSLRTGIFNVADMAIMAGLVLIVLSFLFGKESRSPALP